MLHFSIDRASTKATHVLSQHLPHCKVGPFEVHFQEAIIARKGCLLAVVLSEYDIVYVSQKAIKGSIVAELLANHTKKEYEPMSFDFLDEEIMSISKVKEEIWRVYFDGASNMIGQGIGAVLISPSGQYFPATAKLMFTCTNNVAEYEAYILALQIAIEKKIRF
ncbi:uncharacterized protein [Gossypium hirsutum]|uniref:RNase H type-1 domain-containing protein n=1 Tax=Gossypium hirsutum TaxID=3635 RepID=A0A1U8NIM6_GOSHI|nr:uncharacterized protein LOC107947836 [Gossypium hirsutum]